MMGLSSANACRSPLTVYCLAGKVTFRPLPLRRSQMENPINFSPSSGPSVKMQFGVGELARRIALVVRGDLDVHECPLVYLWFRAYGGAVGTAPRGRRGQPGEVF